MIILIHERIHLLQKEDFFSRKVTYLTEGNIWISFNLVLKYNKMNYMHIIKWTCKYEPLLN